ncbi:uncharacterized protein CIMG_13395 [Coccidioides immitis RS]|uniref:Uncharacterized protein n=1 Tax=Coccidioides immitis (strain RS) TaxID=246410 RepID=A0A0D8JV66_COCIM|nr:uncharacterized protein CIMG_13395 [Coccidioides immitis RS]KJF61049.1 hypothetical protein CIMG_13395 [Coccidioides immitis RS]
MREDVEKVNFACWGCYVKGVASQINEDADIIHQGKARRKAVGAFETGQKTHNNRPLHVTEASLPKWASNGLVRRKR